MSDQLHDGVEITGALNPGYEEILTPEALEFLALLHREFDSQRRELIGRRRRIQSDVNAGTAPVFWIATELIRTNRHWHVAPTPKDLERRLVEITGPTDRKIMINALNSGADVFMADFEDANSPTWENMVEGQINLCDAVRGDISLTSPEGKEYKLAQQTATLMVRPRGWHLVEKHMQIDDKPISASLFDFGLYFFHNAKALIEKSSGPYFYLPKLENHREARLWNEVFNMAQDRLGIPRGTIRATVLIENILAAFEMEEILYELRDHSAGLNAGRWDYIFSVIKKFRRHPEGLLPDRSLITMTVPFMRAYTEMLVRICHKRGAHAIGGMAAFIPSRSNPEINEAALQQVREDKLRESSDGFDGTWVAHPDLVPVAREVFEEALGDQDHQKDRLREDVDVGAADLLNFVVPGGEITEAGLRQNISVGLQYIESWLRGVGAAAIFNLMEDTATAEISRSQVWQWIRHNDAVLPDGREITSDLYREIADEEMAKICEMWGKEVYEQSRIETARELFDELVTARRFVSFLTLPAYDVLE